MIRFVLVVALLSLAGCKKDLRVSATIPPGLHPGQVRVFAGGVELYVDGDPNVETNWPADLAPDRDSVEVELEARLPCGTKRFKVKPRLGPPIGKTEQLVTDFTKELGVPSDLLLDPALEGALTMGEFKVPSPFPTTLSVAFGDCPRQVMVAGAPVLIPETHSRVLLARSADRCFAKGIANYGPPGCAADTSVTLTGASTYALDERFDHVFEAVPQTIKTTGRCASLRWLQVCH
jgi:hypothetical protein